MIGTATCDRSSEALSVVAMCCGSRLGTATLLAAEEL